MFELKHDLWISSYLTFPDFLSFDWKENIDLWSVWLICSVGILLYDISWHRNDIYYNHETVIMLMILISWWAAGLTWYHYAHISRGVSTHVATEFMSHCSEKIMNRCQFIKKNITKPVQKSIPGKHDQVLIHEENKSVVLTIPTA